MLLTQGSASPLQAISFLVNAQHENVEQDVVAPVTHVMFFLGTETNVGAMSHGGRRLFGMQSFARMGLIHFCGHLLVMRTQNQAARQLCCPTKWQRKTQEVTTDHKQRRNYHGCDLKCLFRMTLL
jgi:hypothetical protein